MFFVGMIFTWIFVGMIFAGMIFGGMIFAGVVRLALVEDVSDVVGGGGTIIPVILPVSPPLISSLAAAARDATFMRLFARLSFSISSMLPGSMMKFNMDITYPWIASTFSLSLFIFSARSMSEAIRSSK